MQNNLTKDLEQVGWKKSILGKGKSKDYNEDFVCYIRRRNFVPIPGEGNNADTLNPPKNGHLSAGSKNTMGTHTVPMTPKMQRMAELLSLQAIRASKGSFVIALDTEFTRPQKKLCKRQKKTV